MQVPMCQLENQNGAAEGRPVAVWLGACCVKLGARYQLPPVLQPPVLTGAHVRVTVELVFVIV